MAEQVTNYQCPNCTGPMHFDPASGKLVCDYCSSSFTVEEIEKLFAEKNEQAGQAAAQAANAEQPEGSPWSEAEANGLRVYNCPSCGAELIFDQNTAASGCPYCGNPTIVPGSLSGALRPDWVIPFKLTKEQAVSELKKHYRKKPLLPKLFSQQNHLEEVKGVYAPFWLFTGETTGEATFDATRVKHYRQGSYDVTETSHYDCFRSGSLHFERIPVDSSTKMPDEHMDAIEPYDYTDLKPFSTGYLAGYMADKYDVDVDTAQERAQKRASGTLEDALKSTVEGYSTVTRRESGSAFARGQVQYALLPVWLLTTKWNGKNYLFSINGQTGKPVGDLPISKARLAGWFFGIWAAVAAVVLAVIGTVRL